MKTFQIRITKEGMHRCLKFNDVPIDIVIYGTEENLEQIAECASVGVNIQECNWDNVFQSGVWEHYSDHVCEALYARLEPFTIIHAGRVQYDI